MLGAHVAQVDVVVGEVGTAARAADRVRRAGDAVGVVVKLQPKVTRGPGRLAARPATIGSSPLTHRTLSAGRASATAEIASATA